MNMLPRDMQLANEYTYSRKFIDEYIDKAIRGNPDMEDKVQQGVHLLLEMIHKDHGYASKNARIAQLLNVELEPLVRSILSLIHI